jgi:ribulokinase
MGAALLAAYGVKLISQDTARGGWVKLVERVKPDATRQAMYAERFAIYTDLYPALKPVMHRLQAK